MRAKTINEYMGFSPLVGKPQEEVLRVFSNFVKNTEGDIRLNLTQLPEAVDFKNEGVVSLDKLTSLPEGVKFNNKGNVYMSDLKIISSTIKFNNSGGVYLMGLTDIDGDGFVEFNNGGDVLVDSLENIHKKVIFNNYGDILLCSLKIIPNNVVINNHGYKVYLKNTRKKSIFVKDN